MLHQMIIQNSKAVDIGVTTKRTLHSLKQNDQITQHSIGMIKYQPKKKENKTGIDLQTEACVTMEDGAYLWLQNLDGNITTPVYFT